MFACGKQSNTGGNEEGLETRLGLLQCTSVCKLRVLLCIAFSNQIKCVESTRSTSNHNILASKVHVVSVLLSA